MEDTIEICSKCGKMPRAIDQASGFFNCTRCGNNQLMSVKADDYETVATELDRDYQERVALMRRETVEKEMPIENPKKKSSRTKKSVSKKKTVKKKAAAKKSTTKKKPKPKAAPKKKATRKKKK
jgi:hypothetical protein